MGLLTSEIDVHLFQTCLQALPRDSASIQEVWSLPCHKHWVSSWNGAKMAAQRRVASPIPRRLKQLSLLVDTKMKANLSPNENNLE